MDKNGKTQSDLIRDLHIGSSTISSWCTGAKLPRMGKIQLLADYFNIEKSELIEDVSSNDCIVLTDDEADIILTYRNSDTLTKAMVLRTLGIEKNAEQQDA